MRLRRARRTRLRTRLLAVVLGLIAVVAVAVATTTELVLHHYLLGRLDTQLAAAVNRSRGAYDGDGNPTYGHPGPGGDADDDGGGGAGSSGAGSSGAGSSGAGSSGPPGDGMPGGPVGLGIIGQPAGTLQAQVVNGVIAGADAARITDDGHEQALSAADIAVLSALPKDGSPHTRAVPGLGGYRLISATEPDGDTTVTTITGLPLAGVDQTIEHVGFAELALTLVGLAVAGVAGAVIVGRTLRPLGRVAAVATRVTELELDRGDVTLGVRVPESETDTHTEVGQVGAALNSLLGHVDSALSARQASETRVRQFVADASHELRTPLAAIRGYAELTRPARPASPPDVGHALTRIESEATRMTTMVEDLLLLARLDAGRPLELAPVDLTSLLVDAVSDAHAAGPDHLWRLELPDEAVSVRGDGQRLQQVVANLLANARAHTPTGTTVTAGLTDAVDGARIRIADDGPGIPAALLPTVFERFARGDSSRSRAAGSTGLGLTIVDAVVTAHGGAVGIESEPGRTVVTVTVPHRPDSAVTAPSQDSA